MLLAGGRVRARRLYNAGIKKPHDLRKAKSPVVANIIGKKTVQKVLADLD